MAELSGGELGRWHCARDLSRWFQNSGIISYNICQHSWDDCKRNYFGNYKENPDGSTVEIAIDGTQTELLADGYLFTTAFILHSTLILPLIFALQVRWRQRLRMEPWESNMRDKTVTSSYCQNVDGVTAGLCCTPSAFVYEGYTTWGYPF